MRLIWRLRSPYINTDGFIKEKLFYPFILRGFYLLLQRPCGGGVGGRIYKMQDIACHLIHTISVFGNNVRKDYLAIYVSGRKCRLKPSSSHLCWL